MPEMARTEAQTNEFRETENERRARRSRRNALTLPTADLELTKFLFLLSECYCARTLARPLISGATQPPGCGFFAVDPSRRGDARWPPGARSSG